MWIMKGHIPGGLRVAVVLGKQADVDWSDWTLQELTSQSASAHRRHDGMAFQLGF